ncbi:glycosyltransferase family 4 protein [Ekhidna sp.]|uniref:glycosyltransferase family 4 protein n=1 Tax=Ekhidna sp. TaxID=2608089 RepID=UPI003B50DB38
MKLNHNEKLVIDSRMINVSGIGRYINSLIPAFVEFFGEKNLILLGRKDDISKCKWYKESLRVINVGASIYSLKEQLEIPFKMPYCDIFISPHYNFPVLSFRQKKNVVFFPDVNHLAMNQSLSFSKRLYARIMFNLASLRAHSVITISEFSKREIVKYLRIQPKEILIAKCGVDRLIVHSSIKIQLDSPYFLFVGNIKPHKNLYNALLAFELVLNKIDNIKFCIVGKREGFLTGDSSISQLLKDKKKLYENVIFTGYINDKELALFYKEAKALFFPSLYEGFGLPPLEAMSLGCPVLCSNSSSIPEICGEAAIYCDPNSVTDMSQKLIEILSNSEMRERLIMKGYEKVDEYSWDDFNEKVLKHIKSILD